MESVSNQQGTSEHPAERPTREPLAETAVNGLFAGVLGGVTVALFFLGVDVLRGEPLMTPMVLGSALFLGERAAEVDAVRIPMVFAYTGMHMLAFLAVGFAAAYLVAQIEQNPPFGLLLVLVFVCLEGGFLAFTTGLMPGVLGVLGTGLVLLANLLSALVMALFLLRYRHPGALREFERVWED